MEAVKKFRQQFTSFDDYTIDEEVVLVARPLILPFTELDLWQRKIIN